MKRSINRAVIMRRIGELAFGRANDAVKLVLMDPEDRDIIDKLDLSLLTEVKRGSNGVIEVKILNRLDALELLARLLGTADTGAPEAASFFAALDEAAGRRSGRGGQEDLSE